MMSSQPENQTTQAAQAKPRVFVVEPQRLFMEGLLRLLADDFEIIGTGENLRDVPPFANADVIVVDADATCLSEAFAADVSRRSGAAVCLLSLYATSVIRNKYLDHRVQIVPKTLTLPRFVETLLNIAANRAQH